MPVNKINLRVFSHVVFAYMIFAFGWWAIHLWRQNELLYETEIALLETRFRVQNQGVNVTELENTDEYKQMAKRYHSRHKMILGEGLFFIACLFFGLWVINRSADREVALARQRRNFLLSITHELKSPIAAIRLVLETFGKRELPREVFEKFVVNGLRETDRLQNLVNDILLAARLEENWRPMREPMILDKLVQEITASLTMRFPKANFKIEIPQDLPPVQADKPGLTAVVQNLLENALKYAPEGSPVVFSAEKSSVGKVRIRIADEGPGIPDAEKKQVFEKFYRLGNEETRQAKGTGLGLYIVRQVVQAHGGQITVSDNRPRGTVFSIEF